MSPRQADAAFRNAEARYAEGWYAAMGRDIWDAPDTRRNKSIHGP